MRLTARGLGTLFAGLTLILIGIIGGYPELAVLGTTALIAVIVAVAFVGRAPRLSVRRIVTPDRVSRDHPCHVTLTVGNRRRFGALTMIASDRRGTSEIAVPVLRVRPGQDTTVDYPVVTRRRGVVPIGPLRVTRTDPFGLVRSVTSHGGTDRVLVYPRVHPIVSVPSGATRSLDGVSDNVPNGTITFDRLRPYVRGDELRHVHWRTSARIGELMVREHLEESLPRLVVLLDDRAHAYDDDDAFEEACDAAASVIATAVRENLPIRLGFVGEANAGHRGSGQPDSRHPSPGYLDSGTRDADTDRRTNGRSMFDRLATVELDGAAEPGGRAGKRTDATDRDTVIAVTDHLRRSGRSDTLICLTGATTAGDNASILVAGLHNAYSTIVVGQFGPDRGDPLRRVPVGDTATRHVHRLRVPDAVRFAAGWDTIEAW